ncbi:helix-hairpin-helix domain-containing protein [Streptococcus macacae]|uniref:ComEA protein n=1 Tax=Streptococcus macacae NCTC 11558 TaxID=764298 RepID=G5JVT1_9STRE|nr:helix-hairpin-helix domain-containing protein [Streptococcus macacae]EHJ53185.1 comEA protein [Streptococcus macacae NCTC 11558]SUN78923.1 competence protein [Streptococcus macacae NCTC 11558]
MLEELIDRLKEKRVLYSILGVILILCLLGCFLFFSYDKSDDKLSSLKSQSSQIISKTAEKKEEKKPSAHSSTTITVDIKGAVRHQGVYTLPADSRVNDIIRIAGGLTAEADRKSVNLAQKLKDESVVYVATKDEKINVSDDSIHNHSAAAEKNQDADQKKINLNTATLTELQTISGIGEKRAQDIIDYRETNGGFKSVEDLKNISGIGDKTFEKLKDMVSVD